MDANPQQDILPALRTYLLQHAPLDWPEAFPVRLQLDTGERELPTLILTVQEEQVTHPRLMRVVIGLDFMFRADEGRAVAMSTVGATQRLLIDPRPLLDWLNDPVSNPAACRLGYRRWWAQGAESEIDDNRNWIHRLRFQLYLHQR